MTDEDNDNDREEYINNIRAQVMAILNNVKEEMGVDTPVEIKIEDGNKDD